MRWHYRIKEKSKRLYIYAYSRETDELDGLIVFDTEKQFASLMKPASLDSNSKKAQSKAVEHFAKVIDQGFPDGCYVCCG